MLTSIDLVKSLLDISSTTHDTLLCSLCSAVSEWLPSVCEREFAYQSGRVEQHDGGTDFIRTHLFPILSVSELKEDAVGDFEDPDTELVEGEDFRVEACNRTERNRGIVRKLYGRFLAGPATVRITYAGGYHTGDAEDKPSGVDLLPPAVRYAVAQMAAHMFRNRERFGNRAVTVGDMQITEVQDGLLRIVDQMLSAYKADV